MLSPDIVSQLRVAMMEVDIENLSDRVAEKWQASINSRELFSKMEEGIPYSRDRMERSFKNSSYDIVTVVGPYLDPAKNPIDAERVMKGDFGPLIIEIEVPRLNND
jgi:hypothetical protein